MVYYAMMRGEFTMAELYNHREVETKWQKVWDDEKAFKTSDDFTKPKYYWLSSLILQDRDFM